MKYVQPTNSDRQNLSPDNYADWKGKNPIDTPERLKAALQDAIKIELATIPPYLCALWSIKEGTNRVATGIIRSVVMEEMLHLCLAANLLNAIGGKPVIDHTTMLHYPGPLPKNDKNFEVGLIKFSPAAIDTFLKIEKPAKNNNPPPGGDFDSIGQFYTAILWALKEMGDRIFTGDAKKQITADHYWGSGGKLIVVTDLKTARQAIEEIIGQGEGIDGKIDDGIDGNFKDQQELAHYFRFKEIHEGRRYKEGDTTQGHPSGEPIDVDWGAVYHMTPNPTLAGYDDPEVHAKALEFNKAYAQLLKNIHDACNGHQDALKPAIPLMYELKYQAVGLMNIPVGKNGMTAGPTFEAV